MINHIAPLQIVLDRLGCADPAKGTFFFWDEVKDWPAGVLDLLVTSGLLQQAQPRDTIECDGCEENCINMRVEVYPAQEDKPGRAFITCDKRDDMGRVRVDFRRMEQWQTTGGLIAAALARLLGLPRTATQATDGNQWNIGTLKGKKHNSPVKLLAGDGLTLALAGHAVPLVEVLTIEENALALDKDVLIGLVDKPGSAGGDSKDQYTEKINVFNFGNNEIEGYAAANLKPSVSAMQIKLHFAVINANEDANHEWWTKMMRNASDNGLKGCRVGRGRKGAVGSLWRPDLVAVWLVERTDKKLEGSMSKNAARAALKKFTGYEEVAEELFPKDD